MTKLFKIIMDILIILFIVSLVAVFVPPVIGFTTAVAEPETESNLQTGTIAYGSKVSLEDLAKGDTIIYSSDYELFIYEIVEDVDTQSGTLTVKAYTDSEPETIQLRRSASKLVFYVPFIGYILIALHSSEGIIILGLGAALLIVLFVIAEILNKKAKGRKNKDDDEEEEQDRKYFRDLAIGQARPSGLDSLGTLTIPPVADLMEEDHAEMAMANTIALDEELENPELILEHPAEDLGKTASVVLPADAIPVSEAAPIAAAAAAVTGAAAATAAVADDALKGSEADASSDAAPSFENETAPISENIPVSHEIEKTEDFTNIGSALEIALENEQLNQTPHSVSRPAQASAPAEAAPVEEIELAIPARTLDELLQEAYANGEDPKVTKDAATGITFVDYSNCL